MENPRTINRFFVAMLVVFAAAAIAASIHFRDGYFLLGFVAVLVLIFLWFGFVAILNVIMFAPIFWLMAKLTARKPKIK